MKTLDQMTPDELRELANKREQELEDKMYEPTHTGTLKHSLYECLDIGGYEGNLVTKEITKEIIKEAFLLTLKKGTIFYKNKYGWFDNNWGLDSQSNDWAKDNLENIKPITKK